MIENNRQNNPPEESLSSEVRQIFGEPINKINRQIETERENTRTRSPFVKFLQALLITSVVSAILTFAYGIYNFPDAPLRLKDNGEYRGKS
jgi:hypothetical protein